MLIDMTKAVRIGSLSPAEREEKVQGEWYAVSDNPRTVAKMNSYLVCDPVLVGDDIEIQSDGLPSFKLSNDDFLVPAEAFDDPEPGDSLVAHVERWLNGDVPSRGIAADIIYYFTSEQREGGRQYPEAEKWRDADALTPYVAELIGAALVAGATVDQAARLGQWFLSGERMPLMHAHFTPKDPAVAQLNKFLVDAESRVEKVMGDMGVLADNAHPTDVDIVGGVFDRAHRRMLDILGFPRMTSEDRLIAHIGAMFDMRLKTLNARLDRLLGGTEYVIPPKVTGATSCSKGNVAETCVADKAADKDHHVQQ